MYCNLLLEKWCFQLKYIYVVRLRKDGNSVKAQCGEIKWILHEGEFRIIYFTLYLLKYSWKIWEKSNLLKEEHSFRNYFSPLQMEAIHYSSPSFWLHQFTTLHLTGTLVQTLYYRAPQTAAVRVVQQAVGVQ
jgi:hypothetical protein